MPDSSVHYRCLAAVRDKIIALNLDGLDDDSVLVKKLPLEDVFKSGVTMPGVLVTPLTRTATPAGGSNCRDDYVNPVLVTIVDRDNREPTFVANLDKYMLWSETIGRAFNHQRLDGVDEVINATVQPGAPIFQAAWAANLYVTGLTIQFVSREPRG